MNTECQEGKRCFDFEFFGVASVGSIFLFRFGFGLSSARRHVFFSPSIYIPPLRSLLLTFHDICSLVYLCSGREEAKAKNGY